MVEQFSLPNGLGVHILPRDGGTTHAKLVIHVGAGHEPEQTRGTAHFVEHTLPNTLETLTTWMNFPQSNLTTTRSFTALHADMNPEELPQYLSLAAEIAFRPEFSQRTVERERLRILREIADHSRPCQAHADAHRVVAYGHPVHAARILGSKEQVSRTTPEDLKTFHRTWYNATNADLVIVGQLPADIDERISREFGAVAGGKRSVYTYPNPAPLVGQYEFLVPDEHAIEPTAETSADFSFSIRVPDAKSAETSAIASLAAIFDGNSPFGVNAEISQRRGLAYHVGCKYDGNNNVGVLNVHGKVPAGRMQEAVDALFECFGRVRDTSVDESDLQQMKRAIRHQQLSKEGDSSHHAQIILANILGMDPVAKVQALLGVTPADIQRVANQYLPKTRGAGNYALLVSDPLRKEALYSHQV